SCPLVPVDHTAWPRAASTRLPSSCNVSVYAPLLDVSNPPLSSFCPSVSVSPIQLTLLIQHVRVCRSTRRNSNVWRTAGDPITFGPKNSVAQLRVGQHLAWIDRVRVGDGAGVGDLLVFDA